MENPSVGRTLDLVVERYEFGAEMHSTRPEAIHEAARYAEKILYVDIWGALQLDLVIGWGKNSPRLEYPKPMEKHDNVARWKPNFFIPPHEYEAGIRWKPLDEMQQFDVRTEARRIEEKYQSVVKMVAYVWDDLPHDGRIGCLLDVVNRNRNHNLLAERGRISTSFEDTTKQRIHDVILHRNQITEKWNILNFTPDERGDTSRPITLEPIDIEEIEGSCAYRDR